MNEQPEIEATLEQRWGASLIRGCEHAGARVARFGDSVSWCARCAWNRRSELVHGRCARCGGPGSGEPVIAFIEPLILDNKVALVSMSVIVAVCSGCRDERAEAGRP